MWDRNFKHFIPMGSTHIFCFILAMQFNFHIFEVRKNITINILMVNINLYLQCSWILHPLPRFYVEFFFLLNNVLYIFFQHFKDVNPLFSCSSRLFLQISFLFFYFQDFLFVFGFWQLFQSDRCLMTQGECMDTSIWSIQNAIWM